MWEGATLRVMAGNRPYGEFYNFYSISPECFGYHQCPQNRTKLKIPHGWCHLPDKGVVSLVESGWYLHNVVVGPLAAEEWIAALK
jgi:hypothetical protein